MAVVYAPNITAQSISLFQQLASVLDNAKRIVLMGDWNAILDSKIDRGGRGARESRRCESSLIGFMACHDLVDRFRQDHP